jgi:hypothetical protein
MGTRAYHQRELKRPEVVEHEARVLWRVSYWLSADGVDTSRFLGCAVVEAVAANA